MILTHGGKSPTIYPTAYVAPNATVCGDVRIGPQCRVMFGACDVGTRRQSPGRLWLREPVARADTDAVRPPLSGARVKGRAAGRGPGGGGW